MASADTSLKPSAFAVDHNFVRTTLADPGTPREPGHKNLKIDPERVGNDPTYEQIPILEQRSN